VKVGVFDIEANGLNELTFGKKVKGEKIIKREATRVHVLVIRDYHTDEVEVYREDRMREGLERLAGMDVVIGHNIIAYDLPVLQRLYGPVEIKAKVFDTLVAARLLWPDAKHHPYGGNSLEKLGKPAGKPKMQGPESWDEWTQEMEDYCIGDTITGKAIFDWLKPRLTAYKKALNLEHAFAAVIAEQQDNGVCIDVEKAEDLIDYMELERAKAYDKLQAIFPPSEVQLKTKIKYVPFNPGSTKQIAERLSTKYGWQAPLTDAGNPSVTETTLLGLEYEEADLLLHYQMAAKRVTQIQDWVRRARECRTPGIIHPAINTNGAATGRCTHQQPNQTACPKVLIGPDGIPLGGYAGRYGVECRSLWGPKPGMVQVGCDASGLELRMLGASLARFDDGQYARVVVNGDIHSLNMQAGGLQTRDQAKTTIYAFLYGSGDENLGITIAKHPSLTPEQRALYKGRSMAAIGREFRNKFLATLPALAKLQAFCRQAASERGHIHLIDGRRAPIRSEHAALNVLLQGNGALVMKLSLVIASRMLKAEKIPHGFIHGFMLNCHDEFQLETPEQYAVQAGNICVDAITTAGKRLQIQCPLDGEYKIGKNWSETH
jgi:DNA polymerase I-like protein with 3'-5' exonuclease and polymerase domains